MAGGEADPLLPSYALFLRFIVTHTHTHIDLDSHQADLTVYSCDHSSNSGGPVSSQ